MADFTYTPDSSLEEMPEFNTIVSTFANGVEQRRPKWTKVKRSFTLVFNNRNQTELDAVRNFFVLKKGQATMFTWTNPNDSVTYNVRFKEDKFSFTRKGYQLYDFTINLIEVF